MKRVLVLAYYFPPLGGAGVQRTVKFVKYLRDFGYEATVVTGPESTVVDWAPPDRALVQEIPDTVPVLRALGSKPAPRRRGRTARWVGLKARSEHWWQREALRLGQTIVRDIDIVYASMSPFGTAAAAATLAREAGKPWVADLRDPWALDEWTVYPSALHRALDRRRMRRALHSADAVVMNTDEATAALVAQFPEFASRSVSTIPNGWDREDFVESALARDDSRLRIVYTGYSHVVAGQRHRSRRHVRTLLGGATKGLDVLARSHVFLLSALERLRILDPALADRIELHIAGPAPPGAGLESDDLGVRYHGYLAHDDAVALMRSADVLFLPMHDLPLGMRSRTVPGKTYEYLASGRPILAALPDGDARDLLAGLPNTWLCRPRDIDALADALREIGGIERTPPPPWDAIERFERRRLAAQLAHVFDELLAGRGNQ